ncbi:3-deoxy-7-phosphoheptulonate synthase [Lutispora sp.]|uniref:3-deoxy-7-phosphoheptulonate synthase n=1 Tax=Lutispora sp. TaxID=2828727 RepID=UPI000EC2CC19|nr:3-deoxy-7-phosphoheptulonate synthase [Lutispora sp.]MEA4962035.1 3-deoxy-7-phosphoheptulonate synthase [Lutispora sp.]HCJ57004.1 3-deoxy-7-phosphoheptulonate synthase [Clostridiaceae bacterium]
MELKRIKKNCNRKQVKAGSAIFGNGNFAVIAGPCAIEGREMLIDTAKHLKLKNTSMLRGGAFKPRTSPYSFQGLEVEGLKYMKEASELTGMPVVTEIMDPRDIDKIYPYTDMFQIGSRNMQNFALLKEVGKYDKPVLLKRGLAATIEDFLFAAEYIAVEGNSDIVLCERGIRGFDSYTRNTLDISAVPLLKELSMLPVIIDPSHGTGLRSLILPMTLAGLAAGADGVMIEVHPCPSQALSDGEQSLDFNDFDRLMEKLLEVESCFKDIRER